MFPRLSSAHGDFMNRSDVVPRRRFQLMGKAPEEELGPALGRGMLA